MPGPVALQYRYPKWNRCCHGIPHCRYQHEPAATPRSRMNGASQHVALDCQFAHGYSILLPTPLLPSPFARSSFQAGAKSHTFFHSSWLYVTVIINMPLCVVWAAATLSQGQAHFQFSCSQSRRASEYQVDTAERRRGGNRKSKSQ